MNDENTKHVRESDLVSLRRAIQIWWYGGESGRQQRRKALGVYRTSESFEKAETPKYHWTALLVRIPLKFIHSQFATFLAGVLVGVVLLWIGQKWFNH